MRNSIILFFLLLGFGSMISCEQCITCEVIGAIDTSTVIIYDTSLVDTTGINSGTFYGLIDPDTIIYSEKCGSSSEIEAFEADVVYAAESRNCKVYRIDRLDNGNNLITKILCGGKKNHEFFLAQLDTLMDTTYVNPIDPTDEIDVRLYVDTTISHPGKWSCR
jgi:hypothetical protein